MIMRSVLSTKCISANSLTFCLIKALLGRGLIACKTSTKMILTMMMMVMITMMMMMMMMMIMINRKYFKKPESPCSSLFCDRTKKTKWYLGLSSNKYAPLDILYE